jgi:hypothetical protein
MSAHSWTPTKIWLASILLLGVLPATSVAAPSISVKVTGVPAEVEYGQVLKGMVEITLSGLDGPSPLVQVSLAVLEGDTTVSRNEVLLQGRGNGVHKLPLSGTPVRALCGKSQARLLVRCRLYTRILTDNETINAQTEVPFKVTGAPEHSLYRIVNPKLELALEKVSVQGKPSREIRANLLYSVQLGDLADEKERVTVHEKLEVTGPVNKIISSQTEYPEPHDKLCEVKSIHKPLPVTEPGVYTYHYTIDPAWGTPLTGTVEIDVPAEEPMAPPERALLIDSATVTPSGPVGGKFQVKMTYHATDLPIEGANVQEWIHFEGPADETLMVERVVEGTGKRTSVFEATFGNPGAYTWRVSVSAPGLKSAAKELSSEVTPATSPVPAVPTYVCKGPVVLLDEKTGQPLPAGLTVGEMSLTYAVDWPPGQRNVNIISWNAPPLSVQEGQGITLTLNCSAGSMPQIGASWFIDCTNGDNKRGIGPVGSSYGDPRTSTHTFAFKPYMQNSKTFIVLEAGRFGDKSSTLSVNWRYDRQEGGSVLTTLKDVSAK